MLDKKVRKNLKIKIKKTMIIMKMENIVMLFPILFF